MNNQQTPDEGQERRWNARVNEQDRVTITVLHAPEADELEGRTFFCSTRDISTGGLRFCVHTFVPVASELELRVEVPAPADCFVHVGVVVWVREVEEDGMVAYHIGVRFSKTRDNRQIAWRDMVHIRLRQLGIEREG